MALEIRYHSESIATRSLDNERPNVRDGSDSNEASAAGCTVLSGNRLSITSCPKVLRPKPSEED